jgi:hypothetical protein
MGYGEKCQRSEPLSRASTSLAREKQGAKKNSMKRLVKTMITLTIPLLVTFSILMMSYAMAAAQEQGEQPKPPATKLEAFQARTGVVLIRGYTKIGTIRGTGSTVTVDAREFRDASNPTSRATGIAIEVRETSAWNVRIPRSLPRTRSTRC